ncbi:MAG: alkaline phosphatase family protein [Actinobacteria bacterium]|nr:alkaline phosphatase family protein [Actinomycetota bacterium]
MPRLTLADVGTSAAAAIGVPGFRDTLLVGPCEQVVVCLIDGLGWNLLAGHRQHAPNLTALSGGTVDAAFPTTTPVGLGAFGTGLLPGAHGLVGASFFLPETGAILSPLHWGDDPPPVVIQPEPTVFEQVARSGARMTTVSPEAYRDSGLTRAVLRGADYRGAEAIEDRLDQVSSVLSVGGPSFTYVYWFELDRIGHEFGVDSDQWRDALGRADALVGRLVDALPVGATLVVTADHGMVDCPPGERIQIEEDAALMLGVERVAGEPRARHVYCVEGAAPDVAAAWREVLGERAQVLTRADIVDGGLMGHVDPSLVERIGDVMAVSRGAAMLASKVDTTVSRLLGQHGALTADEVLIPALVHRRA